MGMCKVENGYYLFRGLEIANKNFLKLFPFLNMAGKQKSLLTFSNLDTSATIFSLSNNLPVIFFYIFKKKILVNSNKLLNIHVSHLSEQNVQSLFCSLRTVG